jgi:protein-disulfide isomerase
MNDQSFFNNLNPKQSLLLGILSTIGILSIGLNIVFGVVLFKKDGIVSPAVAMNNPVSAQPAPNPDAQQPAPTPSGPQSFTITKDNHVRGNFNAPVTIVEFSDFECPFCERHFGTLQQVLKDYGDKVRLVYKHFPLSFHPQAEKAAEATECASEQGKFWEMHDKIFSNQALLQGGVTQLKAWAAELKLNTSQFNSCLDSGKTAQKIAADQQEGAAKGVDGTPGTFINGQFVNGGAIPYTSFKQLIDQALQK